MLCSCSLLQGSYTVLLFHISKCYWSWWQKHSQPILHHCQDHGPSWGWCNKYRCYLKSSLCKKRANMGLTGRQLLENIYKNLTFLHPPNQFVFSYFEVYFQFCPITGSLAMSFPFKPHGSFILKFFIWKMSKGTFQSLKTLFLQKYWKILLKAATKCFSVCYSVISKHNCWKTRNSHYNELTWKILCSLGQGPG